MLRLIFYALFRPNGPNPVRPVCLNPESKPKESNLSRGESTKLIVCLVGFLLIVLATASNRSTSYHELENARSRGAQAGSNEGRRAGEADGYSATVKSTHSETYQETIHRLYSSGDFHESTSTNIVVFYCFVFVGFGFQWLVFYIPRRFGYLLDIDWLVLPNGMTTIDLDEFSENQLSQRGSFPPSARSLIVLLILLPAIGCSGSEKAWKEGYAENYRTAYQLGWQDGAARGKKEGEELGQAAAQSAATTGRAWQFYSTNALWGLAVGVIVGVLAQYATLLSCRYSRQVSELWVVTFIPAFKKSLAYSILARRRALLLWWNEENAKLAATKKLKARQLRSIQQVVEQKLRTISNLNQLNQSRFIELAKAEMAKIVSESEQDAIASAVGERFTNSQPPIGDNGRPWWMRKRQK